ncbi:hypothetical protein [Arthrobacter bambusae]|uniref:Uncharacterized protein n=1 Tax=Arthrobacter bambusae TaxID=1338426 RepID=A0AAW8DFW3_9MICC|nr:hypothetical protein [Arthrobacter bambusae]MDP9904797.1 hypothetical protein [Arthrobacter bambusae]MDQ0129613.1 hypothetical protein [Arthrobacter bambusae]MDQ0180774.1 hypothetical protein [Arthrobacter bambusae]
MAFFGALMLSMVVVQGNTSVDPYRAKALLLRQSHCKNDTALNQYAYTLNNPATLKGHNGYWPWADIGSAINDAANAVSNWVDNTFNDTSTVGSQEAGGGVNTSRCPRRPRRIKCAQPGSCGSLQ